MAARKTSQNTERGMTQYNEELAALAAKSAAVVANFAGGKFFSARAGQLAFNGQPLPGNKMVVIVLDHVRENVLYEGAFDAENPQSPVCFAFGREGREMYPHELSTKKQSETCGKCPMNAWGSAEKGRGKACKNRARLALLPAGNWNARANDWEPIEDVEHFKSAEVAYLNLSVTSTKDFAGYVQQLTGPMRIPPFAAFTEISLIPDPKTQFKYVFRPLGRVPNEIIPVLIQRNKDAESTTDFPYQPTEEKPAPAPARKGKAPAKVTKKAAKRR